jgi:hypothetical protein
MALHHQHHQIHYQRQAHYQQQAQQQQQQQQQGSPVTVDPAGLAIFALGGAGASTVHACLTTVELAIRAGGGGRSLVFLKHKTGSKDTHSEDAGMPYCMHAWVWPPAWQ